MSYVIGVDIGGTFTDCAVLSDDGTVIVAKASSTPPDFATGFIGSLEHAARKMGMSVENLVAGAQGIYHGCTVGTNALVEGKTGRVALLTTRGHRDSIFSMQAGRRLRAASPEYVAHVAGHQKPAPLVPKQLVGEIDERVAFDGRAVVELNEQTASETIAGLLQDGAEAFAVSLLWSVSNPEHELRLEKLIAELAPDAYISVGSRIAPRAGEYERTVAAVINALVGPAMDSYLSSLERQLMDLGYAAPLQVMTCSGGLITSLEARQFPILTIGSGPVAGVIGSRTLQAAYTSLEALGTSSNSSHLPQAVLTADMGGTTFDVGVIYDGAPLSRPSAWHGQYEYQVPTVDVRSIGSGGGSIVRFDPGSGLVKVGPQSAGALPGPACYGRGGTSATVSDADLMLGYLNADGFAGGEMKLDLEAARRVLEQVGAPLGYDALQTAAAAVRIVDSQMADAIRLASVQQGYDPRGFALYAYGGAGAIHGAAIARDLGITKVLVPLSDLASGWSAFGVAGSEALVIEQVAVSMVAPFDAEPINRHWHVLEAKVLERLEAQGVPAERVRLTRIAEMRYSLQINQVHVPAPAGIYDSAALDTLVASYEREYARLFGEGTGYAEAGYAITSFRVEGRAQISEFRLAHQADQSVSKPEPKGYRTVTFVGTQVTTHETPVYDGTTLRPGARIEGPAVIDLPNTSVVVPVAATADVDRLGSLLVTL